MIFSRLPACLGNVRLASSDSVKPRTTQVDNKDALATSAEKSHQKQMDGYITVDSKVNCMHIYLEQGHYLRTSKNV